MKNVLIVFAIIFLLGATYNPGRSPIAVADLATNTDGQLITWDSSGDPMSIGPGTAGQVLTSAGAGASPDFETLPVLVSELATGTDGELITWDASGNPAAVAVGTSAQVLTSNGAGAAPTFQTVAGGATKEFFVMVLMPIGAPQDYALSVDWTFSTISSTEHARFLFMIPNDFSSLTDAAVVMLPDTTETIQWDIDIGVSAVGEDRTADTRQTLNATQAVTANEMTEVDISGDLTGLAANDYVGVRFHSDTSSIRIIGIRIKYN